ncbi:hypothetical protein [Bacillus mycoides]|uniref:hypothetical protein n=1 Tax=Bacillus mycoides TaxID=1405 RepID=UPI000BF08D5E|nr:hypothetical protein [Bacillus mycoides]PEK91432.1 hypothetical protein CN600_21240 [Bacillus mycoides]
MGLSKSFSGIKEARRIIHNDTKWALEMVKELRQEKIESFTTEEALLDELQSVLESVLETINN